MLKFETLARAISDDIAKGVYAKGSRLPTTPELCEIYGVSNTTVKRAMDELELQGLVARRRGSGVYVKETSVRTSTGGRAGSTSGQMSGLTAEYRTANALVESVVQRFSVIRPTSEVAEQLALNADDFVYDICRMRKVNGKPSVVEYTHMPITLVPGVHESTLEGSLYGYLENELGLRIGSAHRIVQAVMPTSEEREWLGIGKGEPLLEVRQVAYLDDGTPFESSISRHTSDYQFYSISTR